MQTRITEQFLHTAEGREADAILRRCVHCGFCTATCPTYQLLGDELDGPRGRIYLIKQLLEGNAVSRKTQRHLDRCLTCRACETTCPSGVNYHRLADIGRGLLERRIRRPWRERMLRLALRKLIPHRRRFAALLALGRLFRPLLPAKLAAKVPPRQPIPPRCHTRRARRMLMLEACGQADAAPYTNLAACRVLDRLGIELITAATAGCCGAVSQHLSAEEEARKFMRRNIDAWWPYIEQGAEAIVITASGCGAMVKDYGTLLSHDPAYADKAAAVAHLARDIAEVLQAEDLGSLHFQPHGRKAAFHSPCTLQHGQGINGSVEPMLATAGYELTPVPDPHLCCGSAGTYSYLQPRLSQQLLLNKLHTLEGGQPDYIATANIGCHLHLASAAKIPVHHWVELLDMVLGDTA